MLRRTVQQTPVSFRARLAGLFRRSGWRETLSWRMALPTAAALTLGLIFGVGLDRVGTPQNPFVRDTASGEMLARGPLARALDEQLASAGDQESVAHIGISFRSKSGDDCRTFTINGN